MDNDHGASDRLSRLRTIRDRLTGELETAEGRDAAPLARELRATLAEIAQIAPAQEVSRLDELAARRANRLAETEGPADSVGG